VHHLLEQHQRFLDAALLGKTFDDQRVGGLVGLVVAKFTLQLQNLEFTLLEEQCLDHHEHEVGLHLPFGEEQVDDCVHPLQLHALAKQLKQRGLAMFRRDLQLVGLHLFQKGEQTILFRVGSSYFEDLVQTLYVLLRRLSLLAAGVSSVSFL